MSRKLVSGHPVPESISTRREWEPAVMRKSRRTKEQLRRCGLADFPGPRYENGGSGQKSEEGIWRHLVDSSFVSGAVRGASGVLGGPVHDGRNWEAV